MGDVKKMSIKEFRAVGYLQEANRRFFHPLGMALEVGIDENGAEELAGVIDCRDDQEGMAFTDEVISDPDTVAKANRVAEEFFKKAEWRIKKLAYFVQPIPGASDATRSSE